MFGDDDVPPSKQKIEQALVKVGDEIIDIGEKLSDDGGMASAQYHELASRMAKLLEIRKALSELWSVGGGHGIDRSDAPSGRGR